MNTADTNRIYALEHEVACAECGHLGADLRADCACCERAFRLVLQPDDDAALGATDPDYIPTPPVLSAERLVGTDGNAFAIIGTVTKGLRRAGATPDQIRQFQAEAMAGDYSDVLATAMRWSKDGGL